MARLPLHFIIGNACTLNVLGKHYNILVPGFWHPPAVEIFHLQIAYARSIDLIPLYTVPS